MSFFAYIVGKDVGILIPPDAVVVGSERSFRGDGDHAFGFGAGLGAGFGLAGGHVLDPFRFRIEGAGQGI